VWHRPLAAEAGRSAAHASQVGARSRRKLPTRPIDRWPRNCTDCMLPRASRVSEAGAGPTCDNCLGGAAGTARGVLTKALLLPSAATNRSTARIAPPFPFLSLPCNAVRAEAGNGAAPSYDYDLITLGAGSGGVRASRFATSYGACGVRVCGDCRTCARCRGAKCQPCTLQLLLSVSLTVLPAACRTNASHTRRRQGRVRGAAV
jgi:hypothetical protein